MIAKAAGVVAEAITSCYRGRVAVDVWDATRKELEQQFNFYNGRANLFGYVAALINYVNALSASAAAIFAVFTDVDKLVPGILAALSAALAVVQQVSQPRREWIRTRRAAELLRRERTFYDAKADQYATANNPSGLLAIRMDRIRTAELEAYFNDIANDERSEQIEKGTV